jgi:hypothetical protein
MLDTLFYKGVTFERRENWSHKTQVFHFLFSVLFVIISWLKKYGGVFGPLPPPKLHFWLYITIIQRLLLAEYT